MTTCRRRGDRGVGLAAILMISGFAMGIRAQDAPVFRADTWLVVVPVAVHDRHGQLVTDLDRDAFHVSEDGRPQPLAIFRRDDVPVSVGLVIDNSGSMRERRTKVEAAALAFVHASNPLDEVFVMNFADQARIDVPLTRDPRRVEAGLARIDAIGGTALRDALVAATAYLRADGVHDRKALLVISDGFDNASSESIARVRKDATLADVAVYALVLPHADPSTAEKGFSELNALAEHTGGTAIRLDRLDDIGATAVQLAHQLRQLYTLAYQPLKQALDGSYRHIHVVVKGRAGLSVRAREGYYATPRGRER